MIEWFNVEDKLPDSCCRVLCAEPHGYIGVAQYVPSDKLFLECGKKLRAKIWAELPQLPENYLRKYKDEK